MQKSKIDREEQTISHPGEQTFPLELRTLCLLNSVQTKNHLRVLHVTCREAEQRLPCCNNAAVLGLTSVSKTEEPLVWNLCSSEARVGQKEMMFFCRSAQICSRSAIKNLTEEKTFCISLSRIVVRGVCTHECQRSGT